MKLHENITLFKQAVRFTANQMKIPEIYVEKDYWVTFALYRIFHSEIGNDTVFKGGTALSKCFSMIERFSEDIDLVVIRRDNESDYQMKKKLKAISESINQVLPESEIKNITRKRGMNRKTAHTYNKEFSGVYGQIRDVIVLEASWLGYFEPYTKKNVISFVGQMMLKSDQKIMAKEYELLPFEVSVLSPKRTICEKIMSLVRFSYTENPIIDLQNKIRHIYDLNRMLENTDLNLFFESKEFEEMILQVGKDDMKSYKNNHEWLSISPGEAIIFNEPKETWRKIEGAYIKEFVNLVYGKLPEAAEMQGTLEKISKRLSKINWNLN